ncbi:MAG: hypothetical protein D6160_16455 [Ketobacter sp.]|nr:MAG: hypothetical protein D6160_16455 [Ketobacter sp.]
MTKSLNIDELKEEAKQYIRYEKDTDNKIAYLTFDRPKALNATTTGMRQYYADLNNCSKPLTT